MSKQKILSDLINLESRCLWIYFQLLGVSKNVYQNKGFLRPGPAISEGERLLYKIVSSVDTISISAVHQEFWNTINKFA